jgi:hypothetical protein
MQHKFSEKDLSIKIHLITISICTDVLKFNWLRELLMNLQKEEKNNGIHIFEQLNMFKAIEHVFSDKGVKLYKVNYLVSDGYMPIIDNERNQNIEEKSINFWKTIRLDQ